MGDTLQVIKFWCGSESGCGSTITFPLPLTLQDTAWYDSLSLARGLHCIFPWQSSSLGGVCVLWAHLVCQSLHGIYLNHAIMCHKLQSG